MSKRKTDIEIAIYEYKAKRVTAIGSVLTAAFNQLSKYFFYGFCVYRASLSINEFAGKTTIANLDATIFLGVTLKETISYAVGGAGVCYGLSERHRRKKSVAHVQLHNQQLELRLDPNRTTSNLTAMGDTNPQDMD